MDFQIKNNMLTITRKVKNSLSHYFHTFSGIGFIPIHNNWYIVDSKTELCFFLCEFTPVTTMYDLLQVLENRLQVGESAVISGVSFNELMKVGA